MTRRTPSLLILALLGFVAGCGDPIADRCYIDRDCDEPMVCSNDGDRTHQGYCVEPPDAEPEVSVAPAHAEVVI